MTAPVRAQKALAQLQRLLMSVHGVEAAPVQDFLVDAQKRNQLAPHASPDEALLLQHASLTNVLGEVSLGELRVALFLSDDVLAQLACAPDAPWTHVRLHGFCQAAEGISHFLYLSHRADRDAPVSMLELEVQAEVDKYLCVLLQLWARGRRGDSAALRHRLFDRVSLRRGLSRAEGERYALANALAAATAKVLEARYVLAGRLEALLREVRRLYRLSGGEKLSALSQGAVAWGV